MSILDGLSAYELGRARGACYGRGEPNDADDYWIATVFLFGDGDAAVEASMLDFERGMFDGAEQVAMRGMGGTTPPSDDVIAAAKDGVK